MKTPLFLSGKYCLSLDDLRDVLRQAVDKKGIFYEEVLTALVDGVLQRWLSEGSEEEKRLIVGLKRYKEPEKAFNMLCVELDLPTLLNS